MPAKFYTIGGSTLSYGGVLLREAGAGALTITKTVTGSGFDPAKTFGLVVTFDKPVTYNGTTSTVHTFNLASGQSVTVTDIPEATTYSVEEAPLPPADIALGYRIGPMTGGEGTIGNGDTRTASASNVFATNTLSLNLVMTTASAYNAGKCRFTVTFDQAIQYSVNGVQISTPSNTYSGDFSQGTPVVLGAIPEGVAYTVAEEAFVPGTDAYDDGYRNGAVAGDASGTMGYGDGLEADLNYSYNPNILSIAGLISGSGYDLSKFRYVVTFDQPIRYTVNGARISTASATYSSNLGAGMTTLLGCIPANTSYRVEEVQFTSEEALAGYGNGTITHASGAFTTLGTTIVATIRYNYAPLPALSKGLRFRFAGSPVPGAASMMSSNWINRGNGIYDFETASGTVFSNDIFRDDYGSMWTPSGAYWYTGKFEIIEGKLSADSFGSLHYRFDFGDRLTRAVNLYCGPTFRGSEMFAGCSCVTEIAFTNVPVLYSADHMFDGCAALTAIPAFTLKGETPSPMYNPGAYDLTAIFRGCASLTSIPVFNTGHVTKFTEMCEGCSSLASIPLMPTDKASNVDAMFYQCYAVASGALALYTQMSGQARVPSSHIDTFDSCGRDTTTGAAELAQIPSDWK